MGTNSKENVGLWCEVALMAQERMIVASRLTGSRHLALPEESPLHNIRSRPIVGGHSIQELHSSVAILKAHQAGLPVQAGYYIYYIYHGLS
jgi:hypothetical protein